MNEQKALIHAIFKNDADNNFDPRGLAIYQRNLKASAVNALSITFPTVKKLIGDEVFSYAAEQLLKQDPPHEGDWGLWGSTFSKILNTLVALQDFPYVTDAADLDFSLHILGREIDMEFSMESISLLSSCDIDCIRVVLNPAIKIQTSDFPVADIYNLQNNQANSLQLFMADVKEKIAHKVGQAILLYRPEFKPVVRILDSSEQLWLELLQQGMGLGKALDVLADTGDEFSLEEWLPIAIQQNLISHLEII